MSVKVIDKGWDRIQKELKLMDNSSVKVGVMGDDTAEDGTNLVDVATMNEFGTSRIPARPFMAQAFDTHRRKLLSKAENLKSDIFKGRHGTKSALNELGIVHKGQVQGIFRTGSFAPNAPSTVAKKESSQPLVDTGRLRQSIDIEVELK